MNNEIKSQLQKKEFEALKDKNRVILKWATGCGKSKMAIDLINYAIGSITHKPVSILFLVAEKAHIDNWKDEFEKWNLQKEGVETDIICYASLKKVVNLTYDIIVMDEAHHVFTEKRLTALWSLSKNTSKDSYVFLLSATLSLPKEEEIGDIFGRFTISTVTLKEAIRKDILPDPTIYAIGMDLDNTIANQKIRIGKGSNQEVKWEDRNKYIFKKIPCVIKCTQWQKYLYYTDSMNYWKERYEYSRNEFHRTMWVNGGSQRKRFLGESKTEVAKELLNHISKRRKLVCFCASVPQADEISSTNTISSKKTDKYNKAIINSFNKGYINRIYAVGMITEGMNLADIEAGIIIQLDGKERLFIQKIGRALRAKSPIVCLFYYRNTQDEMYLKRALENVEEKFVKYTSIEQLKTMKL
jgi:superfamily II DNA or RNA helicase